MNATMRRASVGLLALVSIAIVGTALAWACSEGNRISVVKQSPAPASGLPGAGPSGTEVTLEGESFIAGESVKIYWNELDGPLLAEATVPEGSQSFTQKVTIPKAPADTHTILARTVNDNGQAFVARTAFTVTEPGATTDGGSPGAGSGPASPVRSPGQTSPGSTAPRTGRNTSGADRSGGGRDARTVTGPTRGSTESNRAPRGAPTTGVAPRSTDTVADRSGARVFAGSVEPAASPNGAAKPDQSGASGLSASGDLWGGFSSAAMRPSLSGAAGPAADTGSSFTLGLGLLGLGAVALLTGFGAADVRRRRRVTASAQGRSRQR